MNFSKDINTLMSYKPFKYFLTNSLKEFILGYQKTSNLPTKGDIFAKFNKFLKDNDSFKSLLTYKTFGYVRLFRIFYKGDKKIWRLRGQYFNIWGKRTLLEILLLYPILAGFRDKFYPRLLNYETSMLKIEYGFVEDVKSLTGVDGIYSSFLGTFVFKGERYKFFKNRYNLPIIDRLVNKFSWEARLLFGESVILKTI